MANYWDTFKPGLLAGEDYWEDFTPEAPTETGVVGAVTGKRYQPWEKGYHNIAGLVDDSGQYDAWYDPDTPPETSRPDWGTPEGYDNWKNRIALETGNTSSTGGPHLPEGGPGDPDSSGSFGGADVDFSKVTDFLSSGSVANAILGFGLNGPVGALVGAYGGQIKDVISNIMDSSSGWWSGNEDTEEIEPQTDFITDVNTPTESFKDKAPQTNTGWVDDI